MKDEQIAPVPVPINSEIRSLRPVPAPPAVRWREFKIQILPLLAFGGSLALAAVVWLKAVIPIPASPAPQPPPSLGVSPEPDISVPKATAFQDRTNGLAKAHELRD